MKILKNLHRKKKTTYVDGSSLHCVIRSRDFSNLYNDMTFVSLLCLGIFYILILSKKVTCNDARFHSSYSFSKSYTGFYLLSLVVVKNLHFVVLVSKRTNDPCFDRCINIPYKNNGLCRLKIFSNFIKKISNKDILQK